MRDPSKKIGSLLLAVGALAALLVNAGANQGCSGSRRGQAATRDSPAPAVSAQASATPAAQASTTPAAQASTTPQPWDQDCEEAEPYMHATKAPVLHVRRCKPPAAPANNMQQAP